MVEIDGVVVVVVVACCLVLGGVDGVCWWVDGGCCCWVLGGELGVCWVLLGSWVFVGCCVLQKDGELHGKLHGKLQLQ